MKHSLLLMAFAACTLCAAPAVKPVLKTVSYPCSYDNSQQKALVWFSPAKEARPLFVVLHTWSFGYTNGKSYAIPAIKHNCHVIAPDFRGRNTVGNPQSMGSDAAVADIVSAVEWMKTQVKVDADRIYLIGGSGGGFMALLMAGRHPDIWAGVSAWCPISDLKAWCTHHRGKRYGAHIIRNLKGDPRTDAAAAKEAAKRSPVTYLHKAKNIPLDIATGIHDGHRGSVPISETFNAYNCAAAPADRVSAEDIRLMTRERKIPAGTPEFKDPSYGKIRIHYRKSSGNVRVTIFEGGHTILTRTGYSWLLKQRKGQKAVWNIEQNIGETSTELSK